MATPRGDYAATIAAVAALVSEAGDGTVGVGIPGGVSRVTGLVKNAKLTWLIGKPLQQDLERALGREVRLGNRCECFALSSGGRRGKGAGVVFGVILGTGVGVASCACQVCCARAECDRGGRMGAQPLPAPTGRTCRYPAATAGAPGAARPIFRSGLAREHETLTGSAPRRSGNRVASR